MLDNNIFKNNDIVCIYHSADYDGICSAEIIRKYFSEYSNLIGLNNINLKFVGMSYNDEVTNNDFIDKVIICCDFMPKNFRDIINNAKYTIWIDHHKSSYEDMKSFESNKFERVIDIKHSACENVWRYFYPNKDIPISVYYLSLFDAYIFSAEQKYDVFCFQYGMKSLGNETQIGCAIWPQLLNDNSLINEILERGKIIYKYQVEHHDIAVANRSASTRKLVLPRSNKEYNVIFINSPYTFSDAFKSVYDSNKHDLLVSGYLNNYKKWSFSFYCPIDKDIDVSLIAKEFNGGGHKGAAGCISDKFILI